METHLARVTAETRYQGDLRTINVHLKSGKEILTDAPTDNHGKGEAFSPTDLLASSLVSCMITVMGIQANKKGISLGEVEGFVEKIMANAPRRVAALNVEIHFKDQHLSKNDKVLLENVAINCPVALSLHQAIQVNTRFIYA